jgi:hypothetical protein
MKWVPRPVREPGHLKSVPHLPHLYAVPTFFERQSGHLTARTTSTPGALRFDYFVFTPCANLLAPAVTLGDFSRSHCAASHGFEYGAVAEPLHGYWREHLERHGVGDLLLAKSRSHLVEDHLVRHLGVEMDTRATRALAPPSPSRGRRRGHCAPPFVSHRR